MQRLEGNSGRRAVGISIANPVVGLEGIDTDVVITADIAHPSPRDLLIELESPSGRRVTVWDHEADRIELNRAPVGFVGETVDGDWLLHVVDDVPGNVGQVTSWSLTIAVERP